MKNERRVMQVSCAPLNFFTSAFSKKVTSLIIFLLEVSVISLHTDVHIILLH